MLILVSHLFLFLYNVLIISIRIYKQERFAGLSRTGPHNSTILMLIYKLIITVT